MGAYDTAGREDFRLRLSGYRFPENWDGNPGEKSRQVLLKNKHSNRPAVKFAGCAGHHGEESHGFFRRLFGIVNSAVGFSDALHFHLLFSNLVAWLTVGVFKA